MCGSNLLCASQAAFSPLPDALGFQGKAELSVVAPHCAAALTAVPSTVTVADTAGASLAPLFHLLLLLSPPLSELVLLVLSHGCVCMVSEL